MEDIQAKNKLVMEEFEKRKALLIKGEKRLVEEKEALRSESVALQRMEKDLNARAAVLEQKETKIAFEEQELAKEKRVIASQKVDMAKEKNNIASEKEDFAKEKDKFAPETERLAKEKREITSEKADLAKEKCKIASEKQVLTEETTALANKTRDERQLLMEKEEKLNGRDAQLTVMKRTLLAQQQQSNEERAHSHNVIKAASEDLERRVKIGDLDIKCKYNTLEKEKEKFLKWKAEEESAMRKQKEQLTLQQNTSAKPNPIEELASRGWMSIEDFLGDVARLKSMNVLPSTISSMKNLLALLQSRQKIVDGLIKLDQNTTFIIHLTTIGKLAENGSTAPFFCEVTPDGLDSTLRKLYNSILIKARQPGAGGTSVSSSSWSQSQGTV